MRFFTLSFISVIYLSSVEGITLYSVFDSAEPANGYDKYVILEQNMIYTGPAGVNEGNVFIEGNGAIIDLQEGSGIWVYADEESPASLDMEFVTIINGGLDNNYLSLSYAGTSTGIISNCNFIENEFGVQVMDYANIIVKNCNFIGNSQYGIARRADAYFEISYSNFWENNLGCAGYNENC